MVPKLREILPAEDCAFLLSFEEPVLGEGITWLSEMRRKSPKDYSSVFYDAHVFHREHRMGSWHRDSGKCKACCRDPQLLKPIEDADVPVIIGEYSLDPRLSNSPSDWSANVAYLRDQLSLWAITPGVLGSFLWNHRVLLPAAADNASRASGEASLDPLSLLDL